MLTCTSLASYTQICPNREEAKKSVCFTFSKPDGTPLTAFRKVPEKIGPGKKYRYRKNLVPEKSTGPGTGKNWSRKKVPVQVSEKIGPGTVEFPGTPGHCIFSYLHVPLGTGKRKCPFKGSHHLRKLFF